MFRYSSKGNPANAAYQAAMPAWNDIHSEIYPLPVPVAQDRQQLAGMFKGSAPVTVPTLDGMGGGCPTCEGGMQGMQGYEGMGIFGSRRRKRRRAARRAGSKSSRQRGLIARAREGLANSEELQELVNAGVDLAAEGIRNIGRRDGGGSDVEAYYGGGQSAAPGVPTWAWYVGGGVLGLGVLYLVMKRRK